LSSIHTDQTLQQQIHELLVNTLPKENGFDPKGKDKALNFRINEELDSLITLYQSVYQHHPKAEETFEKLIQTWIKFDQEKVPEFKALDQSKKTN
jgi:amylosucrase